jgi:hypothetical protein
MLDNHEKVMEFAKNYLKRTGIDAATLVIPERKAPSEQTGPTETHALVAAQESKVAAQETGPEANEVLAVPADPPKAVPSPFTTSTATQCYSLTPITVCFPPPDPDDEEMRITLTPSDMEDIDTEIAKDSEHLRTAVFRDLIISKRNGAGLPRLAREMEDEEIERLQDEYRKLRYEKHPDELPEIEDITHFLAKPMEKPKVLIEGVLEKGSKMTVAGCSKGYKTWLMLDLSISLACGQPWLGLPTTQSKVLYLNLEMKKTQVRPRIEAIVTAKNLTIPEGSLYIWNLRGRAASFEKIVPKIIEQLKNTKYDAILLDPLYKIYGEIDENKAGDVARLMNELERLAEKSGAAVILSEHYSKGNQANKESIDRASGSGVFARDPDAMLTFTKHEVEDAFTVESTLRDFKRLEPFVVKWEYPLLVRDGLLNPKKLKTGITKEAVFTVDDILKVVAVENVTKPDLMDQVIKATQMSQSTFRKLFKEFEALEGVQVDTKTKKYNYTNPNGAKLK